MQPYAIRYDPLASPTTGHTEAYKLLEVSPDLARTIEQAEREGRPGVRLTIKGTPADDAVICTDTQTYALRAITVSNSILCLRPAAPSVSGTTRADLVLQDTCHEILELTPTAPRLARIEKLLKPTAWRGMGKRPREEQDADADARRVRKRYTRAQLASIVQSSDAELDAGLRERNVITIDDHLVHLPTRPLGELLGTLLSLATVYAPEPGTNRRGTPSAPILEALEGQYDVPPDVTREVMRLHGHLTTQENDDEAWYPDVERMVREIGKALLHLESTIDPPSVDTFMDTWRQAVGAHADVVALSLLEGEHLLTPSPGPNRPTVITPFSASSLPLDPPTRFADLFLTRARWLPAEMEPFLKGLTPEGDRKALERLVVKYVRVVKDRGRVWWYARR